MVKKTTRAWSRCLLRYRNTSAKPIIRGYPSNPSTIGEHIRKKRMDLRLWQTDIAKQLRVSGETINNWENNHRKPLIYLYPRIISFLGYNPYEAKDNSVEQKIYAYGCMNGLSHKRLGKLLNVDASTVRAWEQGKKLIPYKMLMLLNKH
jgi:DNA-binding transcriptional regulator YiaG